MRELQRSQILDARRRVDEADATAARELDDGRLTARQRITTLFDDATFTEHGVLAGRSAAVDDDAPADGLVGGIGRVDGRPAVAAAFDPTVNGGAHTDRNLRKLARLVSLAIRHRWPLVLFADGRGSRPETSLPPIVIYTRATFDVLDGLAELSGWAPTVAVLGDDAADGHLALAYLCDTVIARRDGPHASGADDGHVDLLVDDDHQAIATAADYLAYWGDGFGSRAIDPGHARIATIIPEDRRHPYDVRHVISALADADSVLELGAGWATSMITSLATLDGRPVGFLANQPLSPVAGAIDAGAADKAARFVQLCDAYELAIVSLVDNPGYMVGPDAERDGIARHHARPLAALHHRTVPLCSIQLRKAYGLGPFAMSGWGSSRIMPELRLAWPSVESGGMSLEGAAYLVKRKEIKAAATPEEARAIRDAYAEEMREPASGVAAGRSYSFDDVILPEETRARLIATLSGIPRTWPSAKKHPITPR